MVAAMDTDTQYMLLVYEVVSATANEYITVLAVDTLEQYTQLHDVV